MASSRTHHPAFFLSFPLRRNWATSSQDDPRSGNSKELKPHQLRRCKRAWVLATFEITEEDEGPFPKFVAQLTVDALQKRTGNILDSSLIYQIKVKDINDNPPVFSKDIYHVQVSESTAPGQSIFKVEATDKDEIKHPNSIISYYLVSEPESPTGRMFAIDQENGTITLKNCLDYQKITSYKLLIRARDNGPQIQHSSTATVIVNVNDRNNNPPTFISHTASATVSENNVMAVILKVKVSDGDQPNTPGWKAKYTIIHGNEKENYKIDTEPDTNNGILLLIKHLDYEHGRERILQIAVENEEPLFTCPGTNIDLRTSESQIMTVNINVLDENDPPLFDPAEILVKLKEGLLPEVVLGRMNATDPDNIFKNHIRYVKAYDPGELVSVDKVTGIVTTLKELDREAPYMNGSVYDIIIHAVDDGVPPLTGTATLHLHLSDVNDNAPYIVNNNQHMCTNGNARSINIMAADDDENPFSGPFTFELMDTKVFGKKMWKLSTAYGTSSQLMSLQDPLPGVYAVPFKIHDRQGISNVNVLNLRVCHCPDEVECESLEIHRSIGVGTAIGVVFASLLLLLLVPCSFLFCNFPNKMRTNLVPDEPNGSLIMYNEEGGGAPCSADFISRFLPEENGHFLLHGFETSGTLQIENENLLKHKGFFQPSAENLTPVNSSPSYDFNNHNGLETAGRIHFSESTMSPTIHQTGSRQVMRSNLDDLIYQVQRVQFYNDREDLQDHCAPHVYMHEGRATSIISLDSLINTEKRDDFNYLDQTGTKVCKQQ
ncbi:cadherin-like protein 26 isoform X4 [Chiloscyllium plagiosum]|uniref:cadherin-like protein 26 isoform X4 n=1 Tax=Chiloscyllium plagiosum TaxID=36176 RepID=UPI001CB84004|nr:cadherin-like protein 26 isoform X4 [Chiloscyllium plagiosum]